MRRSALMRLLAAFAFLPALGPTGAHAATTFTLGFKLLADQIPDVVGQPTESEHYSADGDSLQQTSKGLMVWRKADNWTAFTDGGRTWINGPNGVQNRSNDQRFDWEKDGAASGPVTISAPAPVATTSDASAEQAALDMVNGSRQNNGVGAVTMDDRLRQVARAHAQDMGQRNYFAHNTPEGVSPFDQMRAAGIAFQTAAENISWGSNYPNPTAAVQANHTSMMAEVPPNDGHRQNILNPNLHRVGIGVYQTPDKRTYYVVDFVD